MADEPKLPSAQLETLREQFNRAAVEAKAKVAELDLLIVEAKAKEKRQALDQTLDLFVHDYKTLNGHDVTFLIAKTKGMGEGADSALGKAVGFAAKLFAAADTHDLNVSAGVFDKSSKWLGLKYGDSVEKAIEKAGGDTADFAPLAKEIMLGNTPDRAKDRQHHYIVITEGSVSDNPAHAAQMLSNALGFNPRLTFDFVTLGDGKGNVKDLVDQIKAPDGKVAVHVVEKPEGLVDLVLPGLLSARFTKSEAEAPKAVAAVEAPKTPKPAAPPAQ